MSVELVSESDLRAALRPYRVDANEFEAGIRTRIEAGVVPLQDNTLDMDDPLLTVAATFIPYPLITGGKIAGSGAKLSSLTLAQKLLGYAALPAISLFLLVGATFFSVRKIHNLQKENQSDINDAQEMQAAAQQWWRSHRLAACTVFAAVLILPMIGATWLLFLLLLTSFGLLLYFLSSFARRGIGNRLLIAQSCLSGLILLSMAMQNPYAGLSEIHFVDQKLISVVLLFGTLILLPIVIISVARLGGREAFESKQKSTHWLIILSTFLVPGALFLIALSLFGKPADNQPSIFGGYVWIFLAAMIAVQISVVIWAYRRHSRKTDATQHVARPEWIPGALYVCITLPFLLSLTNQIWRPATPTRILNYVEAFEQGPYPSITFRNWEIPARWTIEQGLHPDLSRARGVLDNEIATDQDLLTFTLGSAFRVGLVRPDQIKTLPDLEQKQRSLLPETSSRKPQQITSLNQYAWVFYALAESEQLSSEDRDFLEQRLLATLNAAVGDTANVLDTALRVTQLLEVIDRPINRDQYRKQVHEWLREFHSKQTHSFQIAGGFEQYQGVSASMLATSDAVELMQIYGVPEELDLNWVRSYLRPLYFRPAGDKWIAAVTLDRLNSLPGVTQPTWFEWLYYERSLVAAVLLVVLCLYATLSSPLPELETKTVNEPESD
ncbi:hypothetical protein Pan241w_37790 [Gimesia alba]|uniref:Uncharacterized protein n=1 Tax=Gimesia alba TaxID=2527973 RepID=A0A517RIG2_9PLAN|nr:hypothetical protein [Gimesia alba]QDT43677.1 hypothetical protein Pan241w_37790 [Gimesia alba]